MSYSPLSFTSKLFQLTALSVALTLAGCGGDSVDSIPPAGDGSTPGGGNGGGTDGGTPDTDDSSANATEIFISTDKAQLLTGKDKTTVNIRVTDKNGGIVAGVPVIINITNAASYGLLLNSSSEQVTDENGLISVELIQNTVGINSQLDHESLLTVFVKNKNTVKQTLPILVSGTRASNVVSSKNSVNASDNFRVTGQILDGADKPIANADVILYSNDVEVGRGTLNSSGNFVFDLNASSLEAVNDSYLFSIEVKGSDISQRIPDILTIVAANTSNLGFSPTNDIVVGNKQVVVLNVPDANDGDTVVISTNKGKIFVSDTETVGSSRRVFSVNNNQVVFYVESNVPGAATITAEYGTDSKETVLSYVSTQPTKLILQIERAVLSVNSATSVRARVLDKDDAPVKNAIVQFTTTRDSSGGNLSKGVAITDSNGEAMVTYNSGQNSTSTNGVQIEAQVQSIKLPSGQEQSVNTLIDSSAITVQTRSTFISFAFADKISVDDSAIYYFRKGSVSVLNSTGKPAINQPVSINLNPDSYLKGFYEIIRNPLTTPFWQQNSVTCENEDRNNNGILDPNEDFNSNGQLDPVNVAAVINDNGQIVGSTQSFNFTTDNTGRVDFTIRYPKQYANWYRASVMVNTRVDGSESQQSRIIDFPALTDDIDISIPLRPNFNSPFGTELNCSSSR